MSTLMLLIAIGALAALWVGWVALHVLMMYAVIPDKNMPSFNGFCTTMPSWMREVLSEEEYRAVELHEEGHRVALHVWINLALVAVFCPATRARRERQEMEADDYVARMGYGKALASALRKVSMAKFDHMRAERLE